MDTPANSMPRHSIGDKTLMQSRTSHRWVVRDAVLVFAITLLGALLCAQFDVSEALFRWTRRYEWLQFDEMLSVLLVFAVGFLWFSARRYKEVGAMLSQQRHVDAQLSNALADNRRLAQQYLNVQESERKNLARELHDELGQYLNVIKIDAVALRDNESSTASQVHESASAITRNVDHVYAVVTELIRSLRPVGLDDLGLVAAIEHCIDQWRPRLHGTSISLVVAGDCTDLDEQAKLTLYRIAQECLTNIAKHARASQATIRLSRYKSNDGAMQASVAVIDDGVGTDMDKSPTGFGLASMRERVQMLGGHFEVQSSRGKGFSLMACFPT